MKEQEKKFSWQRLLIMLAFVVFASATIGGSTYYVMGVQSKKAQEESERQIKALEKQVQELAKKDEIGSKEEIKSKNSFVSTKYGLSVDLPTGWTASEESQGVRVGPISNISAKGPSGQGVGIFVNPGGFGMECASPVATYRTTVSDKKIVLSERTYYDEKSEGFDFCGYAITTSFNYGNKDYFIAATGESNQFNTDEPTLKKIFESITFSN